MDHDQQLLQLQEFEQQINVNVENVQSFYTKSFLETLVDLLQHGVEETKTDLKTMKSVIRAFSTVLPGIFKTVCQNEAETRMWEITQSLIDLISTKLVSFSNTGVIICSIKCLQVLILLFSIKKDATKKDICLNLIRADHRLLNVSELEKKGQTLFEQLLSLLKSDVESIVTASISCLVVIVKRRPQYLKPVTNTMVHWTKNKPKDGSPVLIRNVTKAIRLAFVSLIRTEALAPSKQDLIQKFGLVGGNVAMFRQRTKRPHPSQQQETENNEKRIKQNNNNYTPVVPNGENVLTNYDITQLPLSVIVDLCMSVLQLTPLDVMTQRLPMLPSEGVTLAATRPEFVRSSTPPYPPPHDQPKRISDSRFRHEDDEEEQPPKKKVEDIEAEEEKYIQPAIIEEQTNDIEMSEPPKDVKPALPSVEERATQSLNMKPFYEVTSNTYELGEDEKKELLKMAIQRILQSESAFQTSDMTDVSKKQTIQHHHSGIWLSLVAKLLTRCTPREQTEWKEALVDFIVESLPTRNDLALEWLYEEYLSDQRHKRANNDHEPSYFGWFHTFLEKCIPTLDAKDRILTKLLLEAPELNDRTVALVKENLHAVPERFVSCVSTLRSLVANRPTVRFQALEVLLDLCVNPNDKIRRTSIVAVKKWNPNQEEINEKVETFSTEALFVLAKEKEIPDEEMSEEVVEEKKDEEEKKDKEEDIDMEDKIKQEDDKPEEEEEDDPRSWNENDVVRHAELFFVLCTKNPSLLKELFSVYIQTTPSAQKYIRLHMINMIKSIGMKSSELVSLLRNFPPGGETLVIRILVILCESKPPTREIVATVQSLSKERSLDVKNLQPILSGRSLASIKK
ncbi:hypothetical protein K501DRAFT_216297 [Backusella circina FSU 941]|nr:hypothetical protein K501DRAFT_216297 [Backusella circina FSU 941]